MRRYWVISPYLTKSELYGHGTYSSDRRDKGFDAVWKYDLANSTIALGNSFIGDPSRKSEEEIRQEISNLRKLSYGSAVRYAKDLWRFYNEVKKGDIVIAKRGLKAILGYGEVVERDGKVSFYSAEKGLERTGNEYNPHPDFLNVEWVEERTDFDIPIFIIGRFKELHEMLIKKQYSCYAPIIMKRIKELFKLDVNKF